MGAPLSALQRCASGRNDSVRSEMTRSKGHTIWRALLVVAGVGCLALVALSVVNAGAEDAGAILREEVGMQGQPEPAEEIEISQTSATVQAGFHFWPGIGDDYLAAHPNQDPVREMAMEKKAKKKQMQKILSVVKINSTQSFKITERQKAQAAKKADKHKAAKNKAAKKREKATMKTQEATKKKTARENNVKQAHNKKQKKTAAEKKGKKKAKQSKAKKHKNKRKQSQH